MKVYILKDKETNNLCVGIFNPKTSMVTIKSFTNLDEKNKSLSKFDAEVTRTHVMNLGDEHDSPERYGVIEIIDKDFLF